MSSPGPYLPYIVLCSSVGYCGFLVALNSLAELAFPGCFHPVKCFSFETELQNSVDEDYEPCDDLYNHVCSKWKYNFPSSGSQFGVLNERTKYTLFELLEKTRSRTSSPLDKVALGYQQCINVLTNEEDNSDDIKDLFGKYHFKWPTLELSKDFDFLDFSVGLALDYNMPLLFGLSVLPYFRTDDRYSLVLAATQGFVEIDYPLLTEITEFNLRECIDSFETVPSSDANAIVQKIIAFFNDAAAVSSGAEVGFIVRYIKFADLGDISPTIRPSQWIAAVNKHLPKGVQVSDADEVLVFASGAILLDHILPQYRNKMADLMLATGFVLVQKLSHAFSYDQVKCMGVLLPKYHPKFTTPCLQMMNQLAPFAVARLLYDEILDPSTVNLTAEIFKSIRLATQMSFQNLAWMSPYTKDRAVRRVATLVEVEAMPRHLSNQKGLDEFYSYLPSFDRSFIADYLQANQNKMDKLKSLLATSLPAGGLPVRRDETEVNMIETNAFYMFLPHMMVIPGAIMQIPFASTNLPLSVSYGSMGHILGHELTHAFDPELSLVSRTGDPDVFYDSFSKLPFTLRLICLANQVNAATSSFTLGRNSLSEAFADNAGMEKAVLAYKAHRNGQGMLGYTADQMFFISACFTFCGDSKTKYAENEKYPPLGLRCDLPAANVEMFAEAFKCSPLSAMYLKKRCNFHR